jgi:hypothetical protein
MAKAPSKVQDRIATGLLFAGFGLAIYAGGLFVLHLYQWLRWGFWPRFTTFELFGVLGLGYPTTEWAGVQRLIEYVMVTGAAWSTLWLGIILMFTGVWVGNDYEAQRRAQK